MVLMISLPRLVSPLAADSRDSSCECRDDPMSWMSRTCTGILAEGGRRVDWISGEVRLAGKV